MSSCGSRSLLLPSWARFGVVFGCSWGRFGAFLGSLRYLNRRFVVASLCLWFRCVRCCFVLVFVVSCSLTHLLIYSSTHGPSALSNPARRTARCAIKSAARTEGEGRTACFRRNEQAFVQVVEDFGSCSLQLCPHRALDARNGGRSRRIYNLSAVLCI